MSESGFTHDQQHLSCAVPPSPQLREQWARALDGANAVAARTGGAAPFMRIERDPRPLGFNDGVIVPPEEFPVGTSLSAIRSAAGDRAPLRGTVRVAVVLVQFTDKAITTTKQQMEKLFFSTGAVPLGSVKEYYQEVTNNLVQLAGVVVGPYTMPKTLAYYAANGSGVGKNGTPFRSPELAHDAAVAANADVDFSPYDNDGNGFVDAFIVVHAGQGAEQTGALGDIWSHKSTLENPYVADSSKIYGYLTIPEDAKIGVSAHELGHLLFGFPDLYDTDYSSAGIGDWCLMAGGSWNGAVPGEQPAHPSAWCKVNQGWVTTTVVSADGPLTVPEVETSHTVFRLWKDGGGGSEYFLLENRQPSGYDAALPGSGLLLWHIDESMPGNTDENHYKVGLVQADGRRDLELNHNGGDAADTFPGTSAVTVIDGSTTPSTRSFANADTSVALAAISASGASMTVDARVSSATTPTTDTTAAIKVLIDELIKDGSEIAKQAQDLKDLYESTSVGD